MAMKIRETMVQQKRHAHKMTIEFCNALKDREINILRNYLSYHNNAYKEMLRFYDDFLIANQQEFKSFDFCKVISWYSILLATKLYENRSKTLNNEKIWRMVIGLAVSHMLDAIEEEHNRTILREDLENVVRMVSREIETEGSIPIKNRTSSDFGIGKNGLYMLMRMLTIVECPHPSTPSA